MSYRHFLEEFLKTSPGKVLKDVSWKTSLGRLLVDVLTTSQINVVAASIWDQSKTSFRPKIRCRLGIRHIYSWIIQKLGIFTTRSIFRTFLSLELWHIYNPEAYSQPCQICAKEHFVKVTAIITRFLFNKKSTICLDSQIADCFEYVFILKLWAFLVPKVPSEFS